MRLLSLYCTLTILIISCSTTKVVNTENNDLEKFRLFAINYNPKYDENEREKIFDLIKLPQIDSNLRRSLILTNGDIIPFFTRPISFVFFLFILFIIISQMKWFKDILKVLWLIIKKQFLKMKTN